jgi:hypothetical protein
MVKAKSKAGVHVASREGVEYTTDELKLLKTQDLNYLRAQLTTERKVRHSLPCHTGMGEHCAFLSPQVGPEREHTHALLPSLMACSSCCRKLTEHAKVYLYLPRQRDSRGAGCYRTNTPCLSTLDEKVCVCARACPYTCPHSIGF